MNTYLVPTILYVVAIVFGVVWIWLCGGFEKHEIRYGVYAMRAKMPLIGALLSEETKEKDERIYDGRGGTVRKEM